MKFSTVFTATFALGTAVSAQQVVTPASDPLALELSQRNLDELYELQERDLFSIVEGLFSSINYTSILDSIDYESIAGWTNNLLVENNNIEYLDNILNFLGDTDLVPFAVSYLLSNNETRNIVGEVVIEALPLIKDIDPTPIFVALKNSGLAYVLVADLIKNPNTVPFVKQVVVDLLDEGSFGLGDLFGGSSEATTTAVAIDSLATINTNIDLTVAAAPTTKAQSIGSIDTASLAVLFSEARTANGNGATKVANTVAVTAQVTAQVTNVGTTAKATKAVATGEINYSGITGPAYESLPPTQFGSVPTSINYSALSQISGALRKREYNDAVEAALREIQKREEGIDDVEIALRKMKRDNIEDLLTTIFASVARSNLLNTTIQYLVTDQRFESTVVELLQGVFENIGSTLTGILDTDWSALQPLVSSLLNSGLLTDFISRAFNDDELKAVLWNDITSIFKRDMAFRDEIVKRSNGTITSLPVSDFITGVATETSALDGADGTLSSLDVTAFINTVSHSFITSNASSSAVITIQSDNAGSSYGPGFYSTIFAVFGLFAMMI
ncbi:putative GPI-anchored protein [Candida albicans P75063]|nr:putative GPI-anchored protein [Candida albicans P75063]